MRLINLKTGFIIVEFVGTKIIFKNRFLEKQMSQQGIAIPPFMQAAFGGKKIVRLDDSDFQRSFKEIYYKFSFDTETYVWQE